MIEQKVRLLPKLERTKFESKSQLFKNGGDNTKVVTKIRKNKVWKQITTKGNQYLQELCCYQN